MDIIDGIYTINSTTSNVLPTPVIEQREEPLKKILNSECELNSTAAIDFCEKMDSSGGVFTNNLTTSNILPTPLIEQSGPKTNIITRGMLHQLCYIRHWELPNYTCYPEENPFQKCLPWYTARCSIQNHHIIGIGSGKSIKKAKNNAAIDFCVQMDRSGDVDTNDLTTSNVLPTPLINQREDPMKKIINFKCELSPIVFLQELCYFHHWEIPEYVFYPNMNPFQNDGSRFFAHCNIRNLQDVTGFGSGRSKIQAKKNAATDFLEKMDINGGIYSINSTTSNVLPTPVIEQSDDPTEKIQFKRNSPISMLHMFCVERHWAVPCYEFYPTVNPIHKGSSWYTVHCFIKEHQNNDVNHITGIGNGKSKKEAKTNAAADFLDKLNGVGIITINSTTSNIFSSPLIDPNEDPAKKIEFLAMLHEFCQLRGWKLPNYEFYLKNNSLKHSPWYSAKCILYDHHTSGEGSNKKTAKHNAAYQMFIFLTNSAPDKIIDPDNREYATPIDDILNKSLTNVNETVFHNIFLNRGERSKKIGFYRLKELNLEDKVNFCAVDILDQIGIEGGFETKYILNTSVLDLISVTVEVAITPRLVYVSMGNTLKEAQENAALSVLIYFKSLLNKFSKK